MKRTPAGQNAEVTVAISGDSSVASEQVSHAGIHETVHRTVLLDEVVEFLKPPPSQVPCVLFDGTLGGGGHSEGLLRSSPNFFLVGVDRDSGALARSTKRLEPFVDRTVFRQANFSEIKEILAAIPDDVWPRPSDENGRKIDRAVLDLGMSSDQLDSRTRGFSFQSDAPLDMRMNTDTGDTASDLLNTMSPRDLRRMFVRGGVHQGTASNLTKAVIRNRPVTTTTEFRSLCEQSTPARERAKSKHPATVPFQALRMAVNNEAGSIEQFLDDVLSLLAPSGRLAVIAFHSLEDQLVTKAMRRWSVGRPTPAGVIRDGVLLTKKAVVPADDEMATNPRARSARLRVFERLAEGAVVAGNAKYGRSYEPSEDLDTSFDDGEFKDVDDAEAIEE